MEMNSINAIETDQPNWLELNQQEDIENPEGAYRRGIIHGFSLAIHALELGATMFDLKRFCEEELVNWRLRGHPSRSNPPPRW
jgi:hypothetical protein